MKKTNISLKKLLENKLTTYSAFAGTILGMATTTQGKVQYTDVNPDYTSAVNVPYSIDFNNDGIIDITFTGTPYIKVQANNSNKVVANNAPNYNSWDGAFLIPLEAGNMVSSNKEFRNNGYLGKISSYGLYSIKEGYFFNASDKYIGVKFYINSNVHYGWVRVDVNANATGYIVKDFAYEDTPNTSIQCNLPFVAQRVTNIQVADINNNHNGSDMQVSFDIPTDETGIDSYRIIVVKNTATPNFTINTANTLTNDRYTTVAKTGNSIIQTLASNAKDSDGDLIAENILYNIFVLSVADGSTATENSLAGPSNSITLIGNPADIATNVVVTDIGNNNNGSDIKVSFSKASNENTISEYRIIVVKSIYSSSFNLQVANSLPASNYTIVNKTGNDIETTLAANAKDSQGDLITNNINYNVYILSVADGINASINALSAPATIRLVVGIEPISNNQIKLYNYKNSIYYENPNSSDIKGCITILNALGQPIISTQITQPTHKITLDDKAKGIYFINLVINEQLITQKIIIP